MRAKPAAAPSATDHGTLARSVPWVAMPAEGDDGLFTQSWFASAFSSELAKGQAIGRDFLDGRIVLYRGKDGHVAALSAYCAHVGADLSIGKVIGNNIRCAFHHWQYDRKGVCVKTGDGEPPSKDACVFAFPTRERFGIIWVFNGEEPLFELPDFPYPDDELEMGSPYSVQTLNCDPWVFCANTPDMQHIKVVHKQKIDDEDQVHDRFAWDDFGFVYTFRGFEPGEVPIESTLAIRGTSVFYRSQTYGEFWKGSLTGFGLPRPGQLMVYAVNAVRKGPKAKEQLKIAHKVSRQIFSGDKDIMNTVHLHVGQLTKSDRSLAKFLTYVRHYPRAHPSSAYIR